jgi:pyridinium-3,5-biscarboxylic acid mononucleotide sulfurtransferase
MDIDQVQAKLEKHLASLGSALLAFSGGVDSSLLACLGQRVLGDNFLAVTACGDIYPHREIAAAKSLARDLGFHHKLVEVDPLKIENIRSNPPDRCYHCKQAIFSQLVDLAGQQNLGCVIDGQNSDDKNDYRPGARAAAELGVLSPLRDVGIGKKEIRALSAQLSLPSANLPSMACLASRVPYGQELDPQQLKNIDAAEEFLRQLGFSQVRVRVAGDSARVEVLPQDIEFLASDCRQQVLQRLKKLGFSYVSLDLEGYRTGSLNEVL